jgi:hypothetical protein
MNKILFLLCVASLLATSSPIFATTQSMTIAPGSEQALERLNNSPRHGEWADISVPGTTTTLRTWIVYPE